MIVAMLIDQDALTARPLLPSDRKKTHARVKEFQGNNALTIDWIVGQSELKLTVTIHENGVRISSPM